MKTLPVVLIAALCFASCGNSPKQAVAQGPSVQSMKVEYLQLQDYSETYEFEYDAQGRLAVVKKSAFYEGEDHLSSWKYEYSGASAANVSVHIWGTERTGTAAFVGDFTHVSLLELDEDTSEDAEYPFLGQSWECSYDSGSLVKYVFSDFTSDGMEVGELSWNEECLLVGFNGSDPSVIQEIADIGYSEKANPFTYGVDPVAFLMGITDLYWQGLAGPRPAFLIDSYHRQASDPWEEDALSEDVTLEYTCSQDSLITHVLKSVCGQPDKRVEVSY